jgi:hypothetical protein
MRAKEFITEQRLDQVHDGLDVVAKSLPQAFVITDLKNQDFYDLYRFGVAIADVRGNEGDAKDINKYKPEFRAESSWGENEIIVSYDPTIEDVVSKALKKVNKSGKKQVADFPSEEMDDTTKTSPMKPFKGYKK